MEEIEKKLKRDIIPWLESVERLSSWTPFRVYSLYFWLGEIFVLLVGLGFAHPAFRLLAPQAVEVATTQSNQPVIDSLGEGIMFFLAVVGLVAWGLLKAYVVKNDLEKKCSLIKSGLNQVIKIRIDLRTALQRPNPVKELEKLQRQINEAVNRMHGEEAWPWGRGWAPGIEATVERDVKQYISQYASSWTAVPKIGAIQQQ
jgi:hypothetical protein